MKTFILLAIRFYQRVLSPRKRFCCAYAAYTGRAICSTLGYRAIRRLGVWQGLSVLDGRLAKCGVAYRRYRPGTLGRQAGLLDCGGCDAPGGCDGPGCDLPSACDLSFDGSHKHGGFRDRLSNCANCGDCDWRRRRNKDDDQYVVIAPRGKRR